MPRIGERGLVQMGKDVLTAPLRIAPAVWEFQEALMGKEEFSSALRVLLDPQNAKPEDMQQFSERYMGLKNPFAKFAVDVLTDPINVFWGVGFAKGAQALKLHRTHPSRLVNPMMNDFSGSGPFGWFRSFASHFDRQGWILPRNADLILNARRNKFNSTFMSDYDSIRRTFMHRSGGGKIGKNAWAASKGKIALLLDHEMRGQVVGATALEHWAAGRMTNLFDEAYKLTALSEDIRSMKPAELMGKVTDRPVSEMPIGLADFVEYISGYLPRMARQESMLEVNPKRAARYLTMEASTYQGRIGAQMNSMGKMVPLQSDYAKAQGAAGLLRHIQSPGAKRVYNRFELPRTVKMTGLTAEEFEKFFVIDLDKMVPEYIHRGATTYALAVPLSAREATVLHGRPIIDAVPDLPNQLQKINGAYATAIKEKNEMARFGAWTDARALSKKIMQTPEQRSLYFQLAREGLKHTGHNVLGGRKSLMTAARSDKAFQAKLLDEYFRNLTGHHDIYTYKISQAMATMFEGAGRFLDDPKVMKMDQMGQAFGKPRVGQKIKEWLVAGQDMYTTVGRERALTNWVYGSTLGFRLPSVLLNLTQIPLVTMPSIGLGATLTGLREGGGRLARTYRDALKINKDPKKSWNTSYLEAAKKHMPEFVNQGLLGEIRVAEIGMDNMLQQGMNSLVEKSLLGFTAAENLNRVATFYGTRSMLKRRSGREPFLFGHQPTTVDEQEALIDAMSTNTVMETQFIPGAGRTTRLQSILSPATRQFSSYPLGFANYVMDAAYRSGLDMMSEPVARSLSTKYGRGRSYLPYARWLVAANMLDKGFGNILNVDLGTKAVGGVVNLPFADQPFSPLPLPPIPNLLVSIPSLLGGDYDRMNPVELPWVGKIPIPKTLAPGGLAVSHMGKMINQTRDGFLLDRNERAVDKLSTYEWWLQALGFGQYDSARDKLKLRQLMRSQDRLKDYRRRMALGVAHGDLKSMRTAQAEYAKEFKDAPPLSAAPGDLKRVVSQMRTEKLQRVVNKISPIVRQRYGLFREDDSAQFSTLAAELGVPQEVQGQ